MTLDFCSKNKSTHTYIHTPLPEPFEGLFNMGLGYKKIDEVYNQIKVVRPPFLGCLQKIKNFPKFSNEFREYMIGKYNPNSLKHTDKNKIRICIHIRRGDVDKGQPTIAKLERRVSDDFLEKVLYKINKFIRKPVSVNIHSDSVIDMEKFETYDLEINTKFDDTSEQAMQDMISCDILFRAGISAFSGVCAFYNTNLVISEMSANFKGLYVMDNVCGIEQCDERLKILSN